MPKSFFKYSFCYFVFFSLALLLVIDFFSPGYILTLDMVFSDSAFQASGLNSFYGFVNSYSISFFLIFLYPVYLHISCVLRNGGWGDILQVSSTC